MCAPDGLSGFSQRAKWPFNSVLVVRVLGHYVVPLGEHRVSYRMNVEVLEDVNGVEIRPRVRIAAWDPLSLDGETEYTQGSLWVFVLGRPRAVGFKMFGDVWGHDFSPIDYELGCGSAQEPLHTLDDAKRGTVGEVRAFWRRRFGR
jgi:hypothetical protein